MTDLEKAIIDSLKRQICETKKQILQVSHKSKSKDLELRRRFDQFKAKMILNVLKLKQKHKESETILSEHRKQWLLDYHNKKILIMKYKTSIIGNNYFSLKNYSQISEILKSAIPESLILRKNNHNEEPTSLTFVEGLLEESLSTSRISHLQEIIKLEVIRREIIFFSEKLSEKLKNLVTENDINQNLEEFSPVLKESYEKDEISSEIWEINNNESKSFEESSFNENKVLSFSNNSENHEGLHSSASSMSEDIQFLPKPQKLENKKNMPREKCWKKILRCFCKVR